MLTGRKVLLVEDESLISFFAEEVLEDAGCEVRLSMNLGDALQVVATEELDFAILDVHLTDNEQSFPVALALRQRHIPFVFATGYGRAGIPDVWMDYPVIEKPFSPAKLLSAACLALSC